MFDFSGTLMRVASAEEALRGVLGPDGEVGAWAERLEEMGAIPGGAAPREVPAGLTALWRDRDLSAAHHRSCYTGLARAAGLPDPALADSLYEWSFSPAAWRPYPDAEVTLRTLRERGIRTAVVSNIGWDLRPVLEFHGLARYVDVFVLSYEVGFQKPDLRIFETACAELGLSPAEVLMVGDDKVADAGASALGCPVHLVDHLPVQARPEALLPVLSLL
ncbi:HAD-IA family hydrolase [Actinocorallia aurea]